MRHVKNNEIRNLSNEEILAKIEEYKEELFNLRLSQATGNLEKPSRIRELRKLVARMKTILRERELQTYKKDRLYGKRVKYSKKYAAHDEKNEAKVGDTVRIAEVRPLSKTKHFRLVEVVEKAVIL